MKEPVDIVIPLSAESRFGDWELRMALRSIANCARGAGRIWLVCETPPAWCRNLIHLPLGDRHRSNKDANLFAKLLYACRQPELSERFFFWSDDQLLLRPLDLPGMLPVFNRRSAKDFRSPGRWHRRMLHTLAYLAEEGRATAYNWDSHVPQPMEKRRFLELIAPVDYVSEPGFCINTLYFGLSGAKPFLPQERLKITLEADRPVRSLETGKLYLGYNDNALRNGLMPLVEQCFPAPCRYEADVPARPLPPVRECRSDDR